MKKELDFTTKDSTAVAAEDLQVPKTDPSITAKDVEVPKVDPSIAAKDVEVPKVDAQENPEGFVKIQGFYFVKCLLDNASCFTFIRKSAAELAHVIIPETSHSIQLPSDDIITVHGPVEIELLFPKHTVKATAYICNNDECPSDILLGKPLLKHFKDIIIDKEEKLVHFTLGESEPPLSMHLNI